MLPQKTVFRLRGCPTDLDARSLKDLLSNVFGDIGPDEINIQSLAQGHGLELMNRTATLMFGKIPAYISTRQDQTSWRLDLNGAGSKFRDPSQSCKALILDIHFEGFTPLNDVEDDVEAVEYDFKPSSSSLLPVGHAVLPGCSCY